MGNCLFDSLNAFLHIGSCQALRKALCDYIDEHRVVFESDILALRYDSVDVYLDKMRKDAANGDHVMICAAALRYRARVHVRMPNGRVFVEECSDPVRKIYLRWVPGHYSVAKQYCLARERSGSV